MSEFRLYSSGAFIGGAFQELENDATTHRLLSMHGAYGKAAMRWIAKLSTSMPRPTNVLLDSGAFTAWNQGESTNIDSVSRSYERFLNKSAGLFTDIHMINLDQIPGEPGRDPTLAEISEALINSDKNYTIMEQRFGKRILPVFHQGEELSRLDEVKQQAEYICISPRNDVAEKSRVNWAREVHNYTKGWRTHGLATTGLPMMKTVPWFSVDSARWLMYASFGNCMFYVDGDLKTFGVSSESPYIRTYGMHFDTLPKPLMKRLGKQIEDLGFTVDSAREDAAVRKYVNLVHMEQFAEDLSNSRLSTQQTLFGV